MLFRTFIEEWWGGELDKRWGEMHFNGHINSQGWLPPCRPDGHWWQGQLYITTPLNSQINRKAPAHTPQGQAESDQEGHPARVKAKGQQKIRRKVRAALHLR
jgi:hypothetical protein